MSAESYKLKKTFITISREFGSEGWTLAKRIEEKLGKEDAEPPWIAYNKEVMVKIEEDEKMSQELVDSLEKPAQNVLTSFLDHIVANKPERFVIFSKMAKVVKALALRGHSIIVGRGGCFITQKLGEGFHIRVVAPMDWRVEQIAEQKNISPLESKRLIEKMEKDRGAFIREFFFTDVSDPHYYDLVINSSKMTTDEAAEIVISAMRIKGLL